MAAKNFVEVIFAANTSNLQRAMKSVGKDTQAVGKSVKSLGKVALIAGATAALTGLGVAAKIGFGEMMEGQKVAAQTNAVLKSTGGVARVTAEHVNDLSGSLMRKSGIDDELIQSGANVLLTFKNIRNEAGKGNKIFDQATVAALDLSVAMKTDLKSANILVGKALNDPIKGLTALSRVGIQFTQVQKDQIKAMVESGNTMGAQKIILQELNSQFGGSAEAIGKTLPGQIAIARESFNNLAGSIMVSLLPAFQMGISVLSSLTGFMTNHTTITKIAIGAIGTLSAVVLTVSASTKAWAATLGVAKAVQSLFIRQTAVQATTTTAAATAQTGLNVAMRANVIGIVVTAVALLAAGLVTAYKKSETFRSIVKKSFEVVHDAIDLAVGVLSAFVDGLKQILDWLGLLKREHADTAEEVVPGLNKISKAAQNLNIEGGKAAKEYAFVIRGVRRTANKELREAAKETKTEVDNITLTMHEGADDAQKAGDSIGSNYIRGQIAGIQRNQPALNAAMRESQRQAEKEAKDFWEIHSPSKRAERELGFPIPQGIAEGVMKGGKFVKQHLRQVVREAIDSAKNQLSSLASTISGTMGSFFTARGAKLSGDLANSPQAQLLNQLNAQIEGINLAKTVKSLDDAIRNATTPEELAEAQSNKLLFILQQRAGDLQTWLSDQQAQIQDDVENSSLGFDTAITNLTGELSRGEISVGEFTNNVIGLFQSVGATFDEVVANLGKEGAIGLSNSLTSLLTQAGFIANGPKAGPISELVNPTAVMKADFQQRLGAWQQKLDDLNRDLSAVKRDAVDPDGPKGKTITAAEQKAINAAEKARDAWKAKKPKFHQGGLVPGLPGSEVPAILQAGEYVVPRNKMGQGKNVIFNIDARGSLDPRGTATAVANALKDYVRVNGPIPRIAI